MELFSTHDCSLNNLYRIISYEQSDLQSSKLSKGTVPPQPPQVKALQLLEFSSKESSSNKPELVLIFEE